MIDREDFDRLKAFLIDRSRANDWGDAAVSDAMRSICNAWPDPLGTWTADQAAAAVAMKLQMLLRLAEVHSAHPAYRPEWAPTIPRELPI